MANRPIIIAIIPQIRFNPYNGFTSLDKYSTILNIPNITR